MKKIISLLLYFSLISNSHAAVWVKLLDNNTAKITLDKQSILQKDNLKRAWVKIEYKTPQKNPETVDTQ
ncbi:MAG: carbonic anhydrase family protein, partial [Methylotenera sp.]|nr:carbonic anhydrase family protein [Methylotenera sp.]